MPNDYIEFEVINEKHETLEAFLLEIDEGEIWFPKSQIKYESGDGCVLVARWIAEEKNLI